MPLVQYFVVMRRDNSIDSRRIIMVEFDEHSGILLQIRRTISSNLEGVVIRISRQEFNRQVIKHNLQRQISRQERDRVEQKKERNREYRKEIITKRPKRESWSISEEMRNQIIELLNAHETGVSISIKTGASTSYISRIKQELKERGSK